MIVQIMKLKTFFSKCCVAVRHLECQRCVIVSGRNMSDAVFAAVSAANGPCCQTLVKAVNRLHSNLCSLAGYIKPLG